MGYQVINTETGEAEVDGFVFASSLAASKHANYLNKSEESSASV